MSNNEEPKKKSKQGTHPNSLANLTAKPNFTDPEKARAAQQKGLETRRKNKKKREMLMEVFKDRNHNLAKMKDVIDGFDPIAEMSLIAMERLEAGDDDTAIDLLKTLAEYKKPKLSRQEVKQEVVNYDAMPRELLAQLETLAIAIKMLEAGTDAREYLTNSGMSHMADSGITELTQEIDRLSAGKK